MDIIEHPRRGELTHDDRAKLISHISLPFFFFFFLFRGLPRPSISTARARDGRGDPVAPNSPPSCNSNEPYRPASSPLFSFSPLCGEGAVGSGGPEDRRSWRTRKNDSFLFSPPLCGAADDRLRNFSFDVKGGKPALSPPFSLFFPFFSPPATTTNEKVPEEDKLASPLRRPRSPLGRVEVHVRPFSSSFLFPSDCPGGENYLCRRPV